MNRTDRDARRSRDDPTTDRPADDRTTMRDVSHTHPFADRGALNRVFERGTVVAADGGRPNAYDEDGETDAAQMKDVDHTPPHGGEGAGRVFERGNEGTARNPEPVVAEE